MKVKLNHVALGLEQGHFKNCKCPSYAILCAFFCFVLSEFWNVPSVYCFVFRYLGMGDLSLQLK